MTTLHFVCRLCTLLSMWLSYARQNYSTDTQGRVDEEEGQHWMADNPLPAWHLKRVPVGDPCKTVSISRQRLAHKTDWRLNKISCMYMHVYMLCACCCLALPVTLNPEDYTPTESQLCAFVLTLPPACCSNWLFSEHMTREAILPLYPGGLKLASTAKHQASTVKHQGEWLHVYWLFRTGVLINMCVNVKYLLFHSEHNTTSRWSWHCHHLFCLTRPSPVFLSLKNKSQVTDTAKSI